MRYARWLMVGMIGSTMTGCPPNRGRQDSRIPKPSDSIQRLSIKGSKGLLYSFFDRSAELITVDERRLIADTARAEVMVLDPRANRLTGDLIWVADLRESRSAGDYKVWLEPKSTWLDRVMPKKSRLAAREPSSPQPTRKPRRPKVKPKVLGPEESPKNLYDVVMFSTAWCPSCKKARDFFQKKALRFLDLDVEKDPQAAVEFEKVVRSAGLKAQAVPVIVVRGQVFQGFSPPQMEAALAMDGSP
jgi:glutaredoxin